MQAAWDASESSIQQPAAGVASWEHQYPPERRRPVAWQWDAAGWVALGAGIVLLVTYLQRPAHWQHASVKAATWSRGDCQQDTAPVSRLCNILRVSEPVRVRSSAQRVLS